MPIVNIRKKVPTPYHDLLVIARYLGSWVGEQDARALLVHDIHRNAQLGEPIEIGLELGARLTLLGELPPDPLVVAVALQRQDHLGEPAHGLPHLREVDAVLASRHSRANAPCSSRS